ncbi:MAG: hypothetical protein L6V81_02260 [Clostridium sp.]|nr:MAG: hypothetical protein L6V81_02260 [Clostridium sp.]
MDLLFTFFKFNIFIIIIGENRYEKENKARLIFWGTIWIIMVILSSVGIGLYMNGIGTHGKN